jgi:hypothetical protein
MSKTTVMYLSRFAENLRREFGQEQAAQVLAGSGTITETTPNVKVAVWMNEALSRLGEQVDRQRLDGFFQNCGTLCAEANLKNALASRRRRLAATSTTAFIDAEIASSTSTYTRMEREGDALAIYYTPANGRKMRCFCPLMRQLPAGQTASVAYCQCSRAFTQHYWETILEQPVQVELTQSTLIGDKECKFLLRW